MHEKKLTKKTDRHRIKQLKRQLVQQLICLPDFIVFKYEPTVLVHTA